jgi:hypothetical protein
MNSYGSQPTASLQDSGRRAGRISHPVSDPDLAQRNRLERDRLIAADAVRHAHELGVRVIEVHGTRDAEAIADDVAAQFSPFLPARR